MFFAFQVRKLAALGLKPLLFIGKKGKKGNFTAEVITSVGPVLDGPLKDIFNKMACLYEYYLKSKSLFCHILKKLVKNLHK